MQGKIKYMYMCVCIGSYPGLPVCFNVVCSMGTRLVRSYMYMYTCCIVHLIYKEWKGIERRYIIHVHVYTLGRENLLRKVHGMTAAISPL